MTQHHEPSLRKPFGVLLLLLAISGWLFVVITLVEGFGLTGWAEMLAYLVGGFAWLWLLPIRRLLTWMETGRFR